MREAREKLVRRRAVVRRVVREAEPPKLEGELAALRDVMRRADRVVAPARGDFRGSGEVEISAALFGMRLVQPRERADALDHVELWPVARAADSESPATRDRASRRAR